MLKDFLGKQVKLAHHGSPERTHPGGSIHSRIDTTSSVNQFIDVSHDVESDTDCRDST